MTEYEKPHRLVVFLIASVLLSSLPTIPSAESPLEYYDDSLDSSHTGTHQFGGHTYNLVKARVTWTQAEQIAQNSGGYLARVGNVSEDLFLLNLLISGGVRSTASDGGGAKYGWLGANDAATEGIWIWNDGTIINSGYSHWGSGTMGSEPDDAGGQDCLALGMQTWPVGAGQGQGFGDTGEWNDVDCGNSLAYIIEFDQPSTVFQGDTSIHPSASETILIPHDNNTRITGLEFDFEGSPIRLENNATLTQQQLMNNSTSENITFTSAGLQLGFLGSVGASIPGAGTGTLNVASTLSLNGNHSYDDIHISGTLDSGGPNLQLIANTISIDSGGLLHSNHSAGGLGRGADGTYTGATGTGGNGAAHTGAGGNGGGNANISNMSYGIGNETGSQGGNVTDTNGNGNALSVGGLGGGVIILVARDIYINGTISVAGNDGEDGPAPNGGGLGIAGAGGGSGGTVIIIADNIWWGQNGVISASGGDGGDGSNGARRTGGPSLLYYDGGDSGGGGGGGTVNITAMINGIIGQPNISVSGGATGTGGAPYRTGSHGRAGSLGSNGTIINTTSSIGHGGSGGRASFGNFTSGALGDGTLFDGVTIRISSITPNGTNFTGQIRVTYDSVPPLNWGEWSELNINEHRLDRARFIQLKFQLNSTSNRTTPTISSISLDSWWWAALDGSVPLGFSISDNTTGLRDWQAGDAGGVEPIYGNPVRLFHSDSFFFATTSTVDPYTGSIVISVPVNATPQDGWIVLKSDSGASPNRVTLSIGTTDLPTADIQNYDRDIALPASELMAIWPTSGNFDASGIEWGELWIEWSADNRTLTNPDRLSLPWNLTHRVGTNGEFVTGIDAIVQSECTDWYHFRGCRENFPLIATGISESLQFPVLLTNLTITKIDDIEPRMQDVWLEVSGSETTRAGYGDLLSFFVSDQIGETNLLINCTLAAFGITPSNGGMMYYDWLLNVYRIDFDSSLVANAANETILEFRCEMMDNQTNIANPSPHLQVTIFPAPPAVSSLKISSEDGPLSGDSTAGEWRHDAALIFTVEEENNRSDLNVFLTLSQTDAVEEEITLGWNESLGAYTNEWIAGITKLGSWDVEVVAEDMSRGLSDPDGLLAGIDSAVTIVDRTAPEILMVTFGWVEDDENFWRTRVTWWAEPGETVHGWVHVYDENQVEISLLYLLEVNSTAGFVDLDTTELGPGHYTFEVTMRDGSNNTANDWGGGIDGVLVIQPPTELAIQVITPSEGTEFTTGDNITIQLAISCNDGCLMSLEEEGLNGLSNGTIEIERNLAESGNIRYYFTLTSEDKSVITILNITVSSPPVPQFESPICIVNDMFDGNGKEMVCQVNNIGETDAFARLIILSPDPFITCEPTEEMIVTSNTTMIGTCSTTGNVTEATAVSGIFAFEWQDSTKNWHRIGGIQTFNTILNPNNITLNETDNLDSEIDSETTESGIPLVLGSGVAIILLILLSIILFLSRNKREKKSEKNLPHNDELVSTTGTLDIELESRILSTDIADSDQVTKTMNSDYASSYEQLPPGGRYQQVPEGLWYIDTDERWWWQEANGGWRQQ